MSKSILESVSAGENLTLTLPVDMPKKEVNMPQYIDLISNKSEVEKIFCPLPGHTTEGSIKDEINTGFDLEDSLDFNCTSNPPTALHLFKETYLSEFETEEDKAKARLNLNVLSSSEIDEKIKLLLTNYPTKADVDGIISGTINLLNYYTKLEINTKLEEVTLNLDPLPILNSKNGVTSGGVWKHVDNTVGAIHRYVQTI